MDGFNVNIIELAESAPGYSRAGEQLSDTSSRLRKARTMLRAQRIAGVDQALVALLTAIEMADTAATEAHDLARQITQIAHVYDTTERQVREEVSALTAGAGMFAPIGMAAGAATQAMMATDRQTANVDSVFTPVAPAMIVSSNRMPSEGWLMDRAIKASLEN